MSTSWPPLEPSRTQRDTCATLHLWTQVVGKVRLAVTPWVNHSWHATLYVTARGLTTSLMPTQPHGLQIDFDLIDHQLCFATTGGRRLAVPLKMQSVAEFHAAVLTTLEDLGMPIQIHEVPSELPDAVPFREDRAERVYDPHCARRFFDALVQVDRVFHAFRTSFIGKVSPVHLFWGAFDLAVTRFSGRRAPPHPGGIPGLPDNIVRDAYSHEVSSAGFWPGSAPVDYPAFYSYAYPEPPKYAEAAVIPVDAFYENALREYVLPYEAIQRTAHPDRELLSFLQSTYVAAADLGEWNRRQLECSPGKVAVPRET